MSHSSQPPSGSDRGKPAGADKPAPAAAPAAVKVPVSAGTNKPAAAATLGAAKVTATASATVKPSPAPAAGKPPLAPIAQSKKDAPPTVAVPATATVKSPAMSADVASPAAATTASSAGKAAVKGPPPRTGNGNGAAPQAASPARPATSSPSATPRPPAKAVSGAGDPYPPISDRLVNGVGAANAASNTAKPMAPRSPRAALEPDTIEMPTNRSKGARHPFVVIGNAIITLLVLTAVAAAVGLVIGKQRFDAPGPLQEDRVVNIPRGSGTRDIADILVRDGVIDQPWVFVGGVLVLKAREDLKAGEYQFKAYASLRDVVSTIIDGRVVAHQLTIPEGLTSEQIVARLLDDDILSGNIKEIPREGTLLPDTYNFTRGITREQMIQRMQQAQQRVLKDIWDHHSPDLPIKTADQLVILASLIEKETGKPDERTRVAAVFVNRLKQKMRLQSDPTIIYGLVGGKGALGRPLMKSEIEQATPYNTYQIDGLPPGPIANPGRASLEAAANPARTRELYFVADGTGGHAFAETYEQHQKNVARLRAIETDQKDAAPADAQQVSAPQATAGPPVASPSRRTAAPRHSQTPQTQQTTH